MAWTIAEENVSFVGEVQGGYSLEVSDRETV